MPSPRYGPEFINDEQRFLGHRRPARPRRTARHQRRPARRPTQRASPGGAPPPGVAVPAQCWPSGLLMRRASGQEDAQGVAALHAASDLRRGVLDERRYCHVDERAADRPENLGSSPVANPPWLASGSGGQPELVSASVGQSLRREEPRRTSSPEELHRLVSGAVVPLPRLDCGDVPG